MTDDGNYDANAEASLTNDFSSTGDSTADSISNQSGGGYQQSDAAAETSASASQVSQAWHDARDDLEKETGEDRHSQRWR